MLTQDQIHDMEHALGIAEHQLRNNMKYHRHGKCYVKSYRNYFQHYTDNKNWNDLVEKDYAIKRDIDEFTCGKQCAYFYVSDKGKEKLQEQQGYIIKCID